MQMMDVWSSKGMGVQCHTFLLTTIPLAGGIKNASTGRRQEVPPVGPVLCGKSDDNAAVNGIITSSLVRCVPWSKGGTDALKKWRYRFALPALTSERCEPGPEIEAFGDAEAPSPVCISKSCPYGAKFSFVKFLIKTS
jgi:hypothetical protein